MEQGSESSSAGLQTSLQPPAHVASPSPGSLRLHYNTTAINKQCEQGAVRGGGGGAGSKVAVRRRGRIDPRRQRADGHNLRHQLCSTTRDMSLQPALVALLVVLVGAARGRELDPAACATRFDVQRDKIIRTEESREMGARYLSELDVGSRAECRRLCCETDTCDVFVYEEKSPGSCYLFKCGPPEDFRCKFTAHGNFSSGVLALSRRLAELQDQERLAPPPLPAGPAAAPVPAAPAPRPQLTTTTTTAAPRLLKTPAPPVAASTSAPPAAHRTPSGRCSRYQWECHSGGECIAVYNACDGVPQCADGSDEAPELGCPPAPPAPPRHTPPPSPPPAPQLYPQQMQPQPYEMEGGETSAAGGPAGGPAGSGGGGRWPHRLLQAQPARYPAPPAPPAHLHTLHSDGMMSKSGGGGVVSGVGGERGAGVGAPHIFSHAGGLMQEPAFELPGEPAPAWPRRYPQHTGVESAPWGAAGEGGAAGWARPDWEERRAWPAAPPPPPPPLPRRDPAQEMPYLGEPEPDPGRTAPETLAYGAGGAGAVGATHDAPKKGLGLQPPPPRAAPPPPDRVDTTEHHPKQEHKQGGGAGGAGGAGGVVLAARGAERAGDGPSERPAAALLLLVLGVCMTGALGVVWGCGGRAGRRRRGGARPLAHDADYLVNGMYL